MYLFIFFYIYRSNINYMLMSKLYNFHMFVFCTEWYLINELLLLLLAVNLRVALKIVG